MNKFYELMLVTHRQNSVTDYLKFAELCAASKGITSFQLREKSAEPDFIINFGRQLKALLSKYNIPLIVNDSVDLAIAIDADGVHLGQTDGDPYIARTRLGLAKFIGVSVTSIEEAFAANEMPINYIGVGPVFETSSKTDAKPEIGVKIFKQIISMSKQPVVAIGGIDTVNVDQVMRSGSHGIAVIGVVHNSQCPILTITKLREIMSKYV